MHACLWLSCTCSVFCTCDSIFVTVAPMCMCHDMCALLPLPTIVATPTTTITAASGCAEMEHSKLEYPRHTGKSPRKYICIYDDMNINGMSCKVHLPIMSMYNYENKKWFFCIHLYKHTDSSPSLYIYTGRPKRGAIPVSVNGSVIAMTTKGKSFS